VRILIIVDCYFPTTKSSAKLVHDLGVEMRQRGHDVVVLAPSESLGKAFELTEEDGLSIARVRTGKIKGAALLLRGLREARLSRTLWNGARGFLKANPCDLIIFYSPSIFFGSLVARLKALWNAPAYLILRDIFPQWAVDAGVLKEGLAYRYFRRRELQQYDAANVIGVQTPANLRYFSEQPADRSYRLEVLLNWTPVEEAVPSTGGHRQRLALDGKVVFFFGGNIGVAQDMDNIVRLAESLRAYSTAHFLLVGEGSEVERLKTLIKVKNLQNIQILPAVGQQEYLAMLKEFDIGLISLDKRLTTQNVPGKLMGYMQFSKPVLASLNQGNDLKEMLESAKAGFCVINGDDEGLSDAAVRLLESAELREAMGRSSHQLLRDKFDAAKAAETILELPKSLLGNRKS
jgi:glycosyltransferase involved in cell wall biosynthesis